MRTSTLTLPWRRVFIFLIRKDFTYFYFYSLNFRITLNLAITHPIYYNYRCNPGFSVRDLRKKMNLKWSIGSCWPISVFNSVCFPRNSASLASFYKQINFPITITVIFLRNSKCASCQSTLVSSMLRDEAKVV